jgi:hypothetical protein
MNDQQHAIFYNMLLDFNYEPEYHDPTEGFNILYRDSGNTLLYSPRTGTTFDLNTGSQDPTDNPEFFGNYGDDDRDLIFNDCREWAERAGFSDPVACARVMLE